MATADDAPEAYGPLLERVERVTTLDTVDNQLFWDQQVMMPEGGTPARSKQRGTLSSLRHDLLTRDDLAGWLDELEGADLTDGRAAVVREIRREHERAVRVPNRIVERISETTSDAHPKWKRAREEDDFEQFAPILEELVELKREYAAHVEPDAEPFEALYHDYEPYLPLSTAEETLDRLREELVPLIDAVRESDVEPGAGVFEGTFDADAQMELSRAALDAVGFPWEHGRVDVATHPFSSGTTFDTRVTTRFDESDPIDGLAATLHEFGHSDYTLGLREDAFGTPLGEARSHGVHESQSRFWENHVGRSEAFWEFFLPTMREHFPQVDASPAEAYAAANAVDPENYIRVEADELTYHMHIVLRFEIERALVNGDIEVREVPALWNEKSEAYLGLTPPTDTLGCLQDIHWSLGRIGTFQNYSIGSVLAAQLEHAMEADRGPIAEHVRAGEFDPIHDWLETNLQSHGSRYRTDELVRQATGESFTADYFLDYLTGKMEALYEL